MEVFAGVGEARGSALSRGPNGWLAARRYLEARGARVRLLDRPLAELQGGGALVLTFPWQRGSVIDVAEMTEPLDQHLLRGGDLLVAYSGTRGNPGEMVALEGLGLFPREERKVTLNPMRWRRFTHAEWDLRPVAGGAPLHVWAPRYAPKLPKEAKPLYLGPQRQVLLAVLPRGRGRIWILPADAFANARLGEPGNAALLETLRRRLGDRWTFDEYHHGLTAGQGVPETASLGRTLDLVLIHLAVLYLAALWTLSRRFGPAWSEPPAVTGSTGAFLLGLGALHHRLGHHREAARRLLERVRELDRDADLPADLDRRAETAGPRELVALAREVARRRQGRPAQEDTQTERENAA
ncbi:MAG TPA: DUF4350 domain-containing protein [Thermoanaerobaculia bacterium]